MKKGYAYKVTYVTKYYSVYKVSYNSTENKSKRAIGKAISSKLLPVKSKEELNYKEEKKYH